MHLAILSSADSWYLRDLQRAAGGRHEVVPLGFSRLASHVGGDGGQGEPVVGVLSGACDLRQFDAVLVRTMPPGSLEQVVFRMDVLGRLEAAGAVVINPARALEAAVDKYLATAKLHAAGLLTPRTLACQSVEEAMAGFEAFGGDVVVKPLFGSEGRGIARLQDADLALRAFHMLVQLGAVIYLQEFVAHEGCDLRLLVLGQRVLGMRRCNPHDWRTNVSRGARTEPLEMTAELAELAQRAAAVIGAPLAGVDVLPGRDGRLYLLEVNAVPGWRALGRTIGVDVAGLVLHYLESQRT